MINSTLLKQRGWRLLTGRKSYQDLSDKQWVLHPYEESISAPAIYLDGELDKVTAVQEQTTYAYELRRIQGGIQEHLATTAYRLRDVQIYSGYLYKRALKFPLTTAKETLFGAGKVENIPNAVLACTLDGNRYFGHWMTDDLTLTLAAQQLAKAIRTSQKLTVHQAEYKDLFDIHATSVTKAQCKELTIIEDFGQNKFKRERYEYMRSKLKEISPFQAGQGVMLLRGKSGVERSLLNENEIADFLRAQGFTIIDPQNMSAREIARQTLGAKIVVGVEGSQLMHGLFTLGEEGTMLMLQPPYRFNNIYKDYTDCLGLKYSFVVGKQVANGFEINTEALARTIDKSFQVRC
jgi:Glycosyltransferase 61